MKASSQPLLPNVWSSDFINFLNTPFGQDGISTITCLVIENVNPQQNVILHNLMDVILYMDSWLQGINLLNNLKESTYSMDNSM